MSLNADPGWLRWTPRAVQPTDVAGEFDAAAGTYDGLVGASPGYHEQLRLSAKRMQLPRGGAGLRLLDVGCGTGASTAALLAAAPEATIIGVDASAGMLEQARAKSWPSTVSFVHAPAEDLDEGGLQEPFDGIFAAYLVRNLADPDSVLRTLRDLLRPGAPLAVHDYSLSGSLASKALWTAVCWGVIIPLGGVRSGRTVLYRYLWRSVLRFDRAVVLVARLRRVGFTHVTADPVPGWERTIVHTFIARCGGDTA
ncbi:MAG: methyltransferase domain-containing protein [Pseudonocardiaceae bacterium]|nr:methyltransferase domain-containing protein [Pseudonocardiaceae bacterium]